MNALDPFYAAARRHPSRLALAQGRGSARRALSFAELAERVPRLAAGLAARGLKPGDRAVLMVPMSLELYELLLACFHLGASAVFLDAWSGLARLSAAAELAAPRAYLGPPLARLLGLAVPGLRRVTWSATIQPRLFPLSRLREDSALPIFKASPDSEALVTFTTGSTGAPKGAPRSHAFLLAQQRALRPTLGRRPDGPDYPVLPVFVLFNLAEAIPTILPDFNPSKPADANPAAVLAHWREEGVVTSSGSPSFYERLAWKGRLPLKKLFTGGAPVMPSLAEELVKATDGEVVVVYGSTEAEPISEVPASRFFGPAARRQLGLPAGKPRSLHVKILKPWDGPIELGKLGWKAWELGTGQVGEIAVEGPQVQKLYINDATAQARNKIRDGAKVWHRSGDAGYMKKGELFLMGRLGQRVQRAGKIWWGTEAEKRAMALPGVGLAVYLGRADPALGQKAVLCLEGQAGLEEVRRALAPWPVDQLCLLKLIPRDPRHHSKPDWEKLRRLLP